jgi:hypothetical protein
MSDPNILKIKEANKEFLKNGDIKQTVIQIRDYLFQIESDTNKREEELRKEIENLMEEVEINF